MKEERRLAGRVLRHWTEVTQGGRFPRRDEIEQYMLGEHGANCVLIGVEIADRTFTFCLGRGKFGGRALLRRHVGRSALIGYSAGGFGASWIDDRRYGDA
jgi:hypothetical protein